MGNREMNQQNWKHSVNLPDEFGRLWLVNLDKRPDDSGSWGLCATPMPVGWVDPLNMPTGYLDQPKGIAGRPDINRLIVLPGLNKWLVTQKQNERDWKQRAFMVAQRLFGSAAHEMIQKLGETLLTEVGPKPFPSSEVIQAAINGHKGFLGLAPLTKADREALGTQNLQDLGFADEPTVIEQSATNLTNYTKGETEKPLPYFSFVKKMKEAGVTEKKEIAAHWETYRAEFAPKAA